MDGLECFNCKKAVTAEEAKFFSAVFVCPGCYERAERFYRRSEAELKHLLLLLKERIREDLLLGRFVAGAAEKPEEVPKTDLFRMMVQLEKQRESSRSSYELKQLPSASPRKKDK